MTEQPVLDFEDLDCFFVDFGIDASLLIKSENTTHAVRGIFETPYMQRDFGSFIVDAEDPSFTCKWISEMTDCRQGDELTVNGDVFYLQSAPKTDGTGLCALILTPAYTQDAEGQPDPEAEGVNTPSAPPADDPNTDEDESRNGNLFRA